MVQDHLFNQRWQKIHSEVCVIFDMRGALAYIQTLRILYHNLFVGGPASRCHNWPKHGWHNFCTRDFWFRWPPRTQEVTGSNPTKRSKQFCVSSLSRYSKLFCTVTLCNKKGNLVWVNFFRQKVLLRPEKFFHLVGLAEKIAFLSLNSDRKVGFWPFSAFSTCCVQYCSQSRASASD